MRDYVTVVSGVPRSGTSMMMQMLQAGGIPALTDSMRKADRLNPRGYFEYEPVKRLAADSSWMKDARGKAVKIIYRLLEHLPPSFEYRVVFMERDLNEVMESQQEMLFASGDVAANQETERVMRALAKDVNKTKDWLVRQTNIRTLIVTYADVIRDPARAAREVSRFFDGLDEDAMAAAIDPALYRHRRE